MLKRGLRVSVLNPIGQSMQTNGTIVGVEIKYHVKYDGGFTFRHEAKDLKKLNERRG